MFQKITSKSPDDTSAPSAPPQPSQRPAGSPPQAPSAPQPGASTSSSSTPSSSRPTNSPAPSGQRNILSNDVHIKGSVRFTNDLLVDGRIEGEISSDGALTVAENAHIKAEITTKSVVIYGKVHGNITCTDRIEIKASAEMVGDVKAATLSIEPGAIFVGKSEVGNPTSAAKKEAPQKPQQSEDPAKTSPVSQ